MDPHVSPRNGSSGSGDSSIELRSDFPCGAAKNIREVGPGEWTLTIPADPPTGGFKDPYDWYFCVSAENRGSTTRSLRLDARRAKTERLGVTWKPSKVPIFASGDFESWFVLDHVEAGPEHTDFCMTVDLAPGERLYVSNTIPCPPDQFERVVRALVKQIPQSCRFTPIGRSRLGDELSVLTLEAPARSGQARDRILITTRFHPPEPDWIALIGILESLSRGDEWVQKALEEFTLDIVYQVNPDGATLGTSGGNAEGINLYWEFDPTDPKRSPEAHSLWSWVQSHPPALLLDFHGYVHQLFKDFSPYVRPLSDYSRSARPAARAASRALARLCDGRQVRGHITNPAATLASQITKAHGTVTFTKFHVHLAHGIGATKDLGPRILSTLLESAYPHRPLASRLLNSQRPGISDRLLRWWEQGRAPTLARDARERIRRALGRPRKISADLKAIRKGEGLAAHWRNHLWSQRSHAAPVFSFATFAPAFETSPAHAKDIRRKIPTPIPR